MNAWSQEVANTQKGSKRASRAEEKEKKSRESQGEKGVGQIKSDVSEIKTDVGLIKTDSSSLVTDVNNFWSNMETEARSADTMRVNASRILLNSFEAKFDELINDCKEAFTEIDGKVRQQSDIILKLETLQAPTMPYFQDHRSSATEHLRSGSASSTSFRSGDSAKFFRRTSGSNSFQKAKSELDDLLLRKDDQKRK